MSAFTNVKWEKVFLDRLVNFARSEMETTEQLKVVITTKTDDQKLASSLFDVLNKHNTEEESFDFNHIEVLSHQDGDGTIHYEIRGIAERK